MEIGMTPAATNESVADKRTIDRTPKLSLEFAAGLCDIAAAQRLRHRVFVEEMGARATAHSPEREHDYFDPWCEQMILRDRVSGDVIGTYRILTSDNARRLGAFCAEREFDLTRIGHLRRKLLEVGRACIDPAYRTGATAMLLWSGAAKLARERGATYVISCASISMADRGAHATAVYAKLARRYLAPSEYRVVPRSPLAALANPVTPPWSTPALIKGGLRLGAWIGGEPAWDPDFNTADLLLLLPVTRIETRCAQPLAQDRQAA
jgi:putative hemolysin